MFDLLKELEFVPFKSGQFELVHQSADSVVSFLSCFLKRYFVCKLSPYHLYELADHKTVLPQKTS